MSTKLTLSSPVNLIPKSAPQLFYNLLIMFSKLLMGFKFICQLEKEILKGVADVQEIFS